MSKDADRRNVDAKPSLSRIVFAADTAISSASEDLLGRSVFAASLAKAIAKSTTQHSLVVAVNGGWGSGKSSVKNMAVEYLRKHRIAQIIEFNPWEFSGASELAAGFFHDLGLALGVHQPGGEETQRVAAWNALATRLSGGASTVKAIGKLLGFVGVPMAEAVGTAVGDALKESGELSKQAKDAIEEQSKLEEKTLSQLKDELRDKLPTLGKPLVVIIDDIDRLASDEVCLLFRMVKANADFPGVIFLLFFDRPQVVRALDQIATKHGEAFLEKIVQVSFDVPDLSPVEIGEFAQQEFDELLKRAGVRLQPPEQERWNIFFSESLGPYFTTLRVVRRFMNSLKFHFSLFQTPAGFELNAVDLAILEMLRVFENDLYRQLPRHRPLLLAEAPYWPGLEHQAEESKQEWAKLIASVPADRRGFVEPLLRRLFPNTSTKEGIDSEGITITSRRVAHPRMFDAYFHFSLSRQAISRVELTRIKHLASDYKRFYEVLRKYMVEGRFDILVEHLWGDSEAFASHAAIITQALFDVSDVPPVLPGSWVKDSEGYEVTNFVQAIIRINRDIEQRADLVVKAIQRAKGLHLPFLVVSGETTYRKEKSQDSLLVPEARLPEIKAALERRLTTLKNTALLNRPGFIPWKLRMWQDCGGGNKPTDWLRTQLSRKSRLIRILHAFSDNTKTQDGTMGLRVGLLDRFVETAELRRIVSNSIGSTASDEQVFLSQCLKEIDAYYLEQNPIP